jgi:hypothetical protein
LNHPTLWQMAITIYLARCLFKSTLVSTMHLNVKCYWIFCQYPESRGSSSWGWFFLLKRIPSPNWTNVTSTSSKSLVYTHKSEKTLAQLIVHYSKDHQRLPLTVRKFACLGTRIPMHK